MNQEALPRCPACDAPIGSQWTHCVQCEAVLGEPVPAQAIRKPLRAGALVFILVGGGLFGFLCLVVGGNAWSEYASANDPHRQAVLADMKSIQDAIARYHADMGMPPKALSDLWVPGGLLWNGPYLDADDNVDPWGTTYAYHSARLGYELTSYGAGGMTGGTGKAADVKYSPPGIEIGQAGISLKLAKQQIANFYEHEERLPTSLSEMWIAPKDDLSWAGPYAAREEVLDAWGNTLRYTVLSPGQFRLTCLGADGKPNGTGDDADATYTSPAR